MIWPARVGIASAAFAAIRIGLARAVEVRHGGADQHRRTINGGAMTRSILQRILRHTTQRSPARSRARWQIAAATVGLAVCATSAGAAIVAVAPDIVWVGPPADVRLNQTESNNRLIAFDERQCFALPNNLTTDSGIIPMGTQVSSHFIHGDPVTMLLLSGRVRFANPIIGVISTSAGLDDSDFDCQPRPIGTVTYPPPYPAPGSEPFRGLEPTQADQYTIAASGRAIDVTMQVPPGSYSDQIRVLTECP